MAGRVHRCPAPHRILTPQLGDLPVEFNPGGSGDDHRAPAEYPDYPQLHRNAFDSKETSSSASAALIDPATPPTPATAAIHVSGTMMSLDNPVEPVSVAPKKISLNRIAHVFYTHANFPGQRQFLLDFGMTITQETDDKIYFRGYGTQPFVYCLTRGSSDSFGGAAFVVDSLADLELATQLPRATAIYNLDAPGGGKGVTFYDPVDNFPFHLVYGQELVESTSTFPELDFNFPASKNRAANRTQRFEKGPSLIHKLGHFGLCVTDFASAYTFYTAHFNFKASDLVYDPQTERDMTCFFHLDRGLEQVDHHSFFIFEGPKFHVHHSSFEVHDFDVQVLGHDWLREKEWENCWGVGRHVMGSQIFDYWFDSSKFILEHYIDGDLVDERTLTNRSKAEPGNLHIWGPDLPPTFMQ